MYDEGFNRPSKCQYCGQKVIVHKNEYGSIVFLDPYDIIPEGGEHKFSCSSPNNPYRQKRYKKGKRKQKSIYRVISSSKNKNHYKIKIALEFSNEIQLIEFLKLNLITIFEETFKNKSLSDKTEISYNYQSNSYNKIIEILIEQKFIIDFRENNHNVIDYEIISYFQNINRFFLTIEITATNKEELDYFFTEHFFHDFNNTFKNQSLRKDTNIYVNYTPISFNRWKVSVEIENNYIEFNKNDMEKKSNCRYLLNKIKNIPKNPKNGTKKCPYCHKKKKNVGHHLVYCKVASKNIRNQAKICFDSGYFK